MNAIVYDLEHVSDCDDSDGLEIHASRSLSLSPGNPQMVDVVIKFLDKGTQVGSSFGKVDLPYESGDKILIPRVGSKIMPSTSIAPSLPLQARVGPSRRVDDVRKVHVSDQDVGSMSGYSVTFQNNNKRSWPYL